MVGEYFILSSNVCDVVLIAPQLTFTNSYSNLLASITTTYTVSNATTVTNVTESYTASLFNYSTSHVFATLPIICLQSNVASGWRHREMISFVRRDFDSLLGRFFTPITNNYTMMTMTNSTLRPMRVIRPVTQPDFLFTAVDSPLNGGPANDVLSAYSRNVSFSTNGTGLYPGLGGPGTIETPTTITFNKGAPVWFNYSGLGAYDPNEAEANSILFWYWGSFDGSTNLPVVYPNGTSLASVESMATVDVSPKTLADGVLNQPYATVFFTATGGVAPYTWNVAPGSQLPPGLSLSADGTLSGTPLYPATYGFVLRMTDAGGRVVDWPYSITINRF